MAAPEGRVGQIQHGEVVGHEEGVEFGAFEFLDECF